MCRGIYRKTNITSLFLYIAVKFSCIFFVAEGTFFIICKESSTLLFLWVYNNYWSMWRTSVWPSFPFCCISVHLKSVGSSFYCLCLQFYAYSIVVWREWIQSYLSASHPPLSLPSPVIYIHTLPVTHGWPNDIEKVLCNKFKVFLFSDCVCVSMESWAFSANINNRAWMYFVQNISK